MVLQQDTSEPLKLCFISGLLDRPGGAGCVEKVGFANPYWDIKGLVMKKTVIMAEN